LQPKNTGDSPPKVGIFDLQLLSCSVVLLRRLLPAQSLCGKGSGHDWKKCPRITVCLRLVPENFEPFNKALSVFVVSKYLPAFYPPNHYVVQNAGCV
jgi:hypothetical protein